tara:strand:- start:489 stop:857 length:369 start_codon:yes stop_codon:yes gene_type:complete
MVLDKEISALQRIADYYNQLRRLIDNQLLNNKYKVLEVNTAYTLFMNPDGRKVMIPTELILEWVELLINGTINPDMTARQMRSKVKLLSQWDKFLHGLESHLHAIVIYWHQNNVMKSNKNER